MSWFKKKISKTIKASKKKDIPDGLWTKCQQCDAYLYQSEFKKHMHVCPKCHHHHYISAQQRLEQFFDEDCQLTVLANNIPINDHLNFTDSKPYKDKIKQAQQQTNAHEALLVRQGLLFGKPVIAAAFEFKFIGGSMSAVVGEAFAIAAEAAIEQQCPLVCFSASGGARMQEGMFSLLQMAKTAALIGKLNEAKLPFISVLTHPTMGGVSASLAMLGDIIIAEPNALIGFSGPRVIEQTIKEVLPPGFQRSEFLLEHGAIDMIVDRNALRDEIASILAKLMYHRYQH